MWDATVFGVFNEDFPLYIKHEDLFEIAHSRGFSKSILTIVNYLSYCFKFIHYLLCVNNNRYLTETSMRAGNFNVYGFLEPQSIQRYEQS